MALPRGLRNWLLGEDADPSVRYRVLHELLEHPSDDPEVVAARKRIGRRGWAARVLREQHPQGQWATPGTTGRELYRPKYVATNWRLLVLSDQDARWDLDRAPRPGPTRAETTHRAPQIPATRRSAGLRAGESV